jgi:DNA-binding CsgD family transcriptional regulator
MKKAASWTGAISIVTALLVLSLAAFAFILSWNALKSLAHDNGVPANLTWLYPLVIDGFIIVGSLAVVRNSLLSETTKWQWTLVIVAAGASTVFNVLHSVNEVLARVIAAVPPVALVLSFELLMQQLKSEVARREITLSLHQIETRLAERQKEIDHVNGLAETAQKRHEASLGKMREERQELRAGLKLLRQEQDLLSQGEVPRRAKIAARQQRVAEMVTKGKGEDEIAATVGVSVRTVQRDIAAISVNGRDETPEG